MKRHIKRTFGPGFKHLVALFGPKETHIRLQCTKCGEKAVAQSPQVAEMFGWMNVTHTKGLYYKGLCVECCPPRRKRKSKNTSQERRTP